MKRPVTVMLTSMMIAGLLTGCGQLSDIGKDKAAKIALADANLTDTDVTRLRVSKNSPTKIPNMNTRSLPPTEIS